MYLQLVIPNILNY